jgi:hypothetical protein
MVHIKFVARPKIPMFSSDFESIALDEAAKVSAQHKEVLTEQPEVSLESQQRGASMEVASPLGAEFDHKSQSGDSEDSETASNNSGHMNVAAVAALARISYNFG